MTTQLCTCLPVEQQSLQSDLERCVNGRLLAELELTMVAAQRSVEPVFVQLGLWQQSPKL